VNCTRLQQVLDAHVDGELDSHTTGEIAAHLAQCAACAALHDQRRALRARVRAHASRHRAPAALAPVVRRALTRAAQGETGAVGNTQPREAGRKAGFSWLHVTAFASAAALAGLIAGYKLAQPVLDHPLGDAAVASHVAALTPRQPLVAVASSDRHTVKPWFQGKVDFAPPVKDVSGDGFVLLGGRLDRVADKSAAAVVYQIRKHVVTLYVWRAADGAGDAVATASVRGFSVATWAAGGLRFAAVSDVDGRDLARFAQLVSAP
jgi:anti-sigma factor RsiW